MSTFVRGKLGFAIALQSLAALPALAQEVQLEEIVVSVSPIRDSEMAALAAKRNADNLMDVISADVIGRFPDQNLADSLGRLPGVAIERDQGQARFINLRGAPFRYTTIAFDGINVPGASGGRVPRFDSFPATITSRLEANKATLPSMPGDSIAGYIDIRTFDPFGQQGFNLATDVGQGTQALGDGDVERYSLRPSWSDGRFGVMLFASHNRREQVTDNREYDLERDEAGELVVNELDYRSYFVNREDNAWGGRAEYRGNGTLRSLFVSTLYSEFLDFEERNQFVFTFTEPRAGVSGRDAPLSVSRMLEDGDYENSTFTNTLGADFAVGAWDVDTRFNRTETEAGMSLPIARSMNGSAVGAFDLSTVEDPILRLDRELSAVRYASDLGLHYVQDLDVTTDKWKVDAQRDLDWFGRPATLQLGFQYDTREGAGYVSTASLGSFPGTVDIGAFDTGRPWHSNTSNSIGGTYYDNVGLREAWEAAGGLGQPQIAPENRIAIEEDITALYAMVTTEFDWGNFVVGARYEQTDYSSSGTSSAGPLAVSDDFANLLPSVHLNIDLRDDLKLRLSGSTGLSRPTYDEWRAAAALDVANRQVRGGNPGLKAEEARGADAALEWYFAPASILSLGTFYRRIDHVIYADSSEIDAGLYLPAAAGQTWTYTGSVNGEDGSMKGVELNVVASALDLLPAPFDGLGISANVTVLDAEFTGRDGVTYGLPGTSELIYNASLFYEKYDLSLRLNYQYRDEWISPIEDPSEVWGEQQRVDLSASYTFPRDLAGAAWSVYANLNNLTDETDVRYAGNRTINQSESYGRYWLLGFRVNY